MADHEIITLGGGCFWCLEAVYRETEGVESAVSGYMGGASAKPTYAAVCSGTTGHVEVVQVTFDPAVISVRDLLEIFFVIHDPTTLNYQGNDHGTQYRSVIFYHSAEQERAASASKERMSRSGKFRRPIVTEITEASTFYKAEEYHQQYLEKNPDGYCGIGGTGVSCPVGLTTP